jgi:hypothetical protein
MRTVNEQAWHASVKHIEISRQENGPVRGAAAIVLQEIYNSGYPEQERYPACWIPGYASGITIACSWI